MHKWMIRLLSAVGVLLLLSVGVLWLGGLREVVDAKVFLSTDGGPLSSRPANNEIYIMQADGSRPRRLTHHAASDDSPVWSPVGAWIAYVSVRGGNAEIYRIHPDGSSKQRLTDDAGEDTQPVWSPDGEWIAFVSYRDGNAALYCMRADGSDQQRLTTHADNDRSPAWSPDGEWIAFVRGPLSAPAIYLVSADGSQERPLTDHSVYEHNPIYSASGHESPVWSPDGAWLALTYGDDLYRIRVDGGAEQRLAVDAANPAWSPDGEWIAYTEIETPERSIRLIRPDGTDDHVLSGVSSFSVGGPTWSPDGEWVAFSAYKGQSDQFHIEYDIYRVRAEGKNETRITRYMGDQPAWSPDGTHIAYVADPLWSPLFDFRWQVNGLAGVALLAVAAVGSRLRRG